VSDYSNVSSAATILASPTELSATTVDEDAIYLSWLDNSTSEDAYSIERFSSSNSDFEEIQSISANENSYTDRGLDEGTAYFYRVRGKRGTVYSNYSNSSTVTTNLAAPTNLRAMLLEDGAVDLSWMDNSENETVYLVERSEIEGTGYTEIAVIPVNSTSYIDEENNSNSQYFYRVKATNGSLFSAYSNETMVVQTVPLSDSLFSFYPNPNNGKITVVIRKGDEDISDCFLRLTDFSGRVHISKEMEVSDSIEIEIYQFELPPSLKNGIYYFTLIFGNRSVSEKFILIR